MKLATLLPVLFVGGAVAASVAMFQSGASPYITLKDARKINGDRMNLGVDIVKSSISRNIKTNKLEFDGKDKNGEIIHVRHEGDMVDISQAERVICVGKLQGDTYVTNQILVKCPSKYEEEKK